MVLGAFLDLGVSLEDLRKELAKLNLNGVELAEKKLVKNGQSGTSIEITLAEDGLPVDHPDRQEAHSGVIERRNLDTIRKLILDSALDPEVKEYADADALREEFTALLKVRDAVNKSIENARNEKLVNSAQEAAVEISCSPEEKALIEGTLSNVPQWFIVSKVTFADGEGEPAVTKAPGTKCPRCWNYSEQPDEEGLCPRCHEVMAKTISR
jgi:hypothetical protein